MAKAVVANMGAKLASAPGSLLPFDSVQNCIMKHVIQNGISGDVVQNAN
jgi:hypothetical protein